MHTALNPEQQQRGLENEQTPDGKPEHLNLRGGCPGKVSDIHDMHLKDWRS
jgi:hypothetical protein